ncbi:MAG: hypothetical protein DPW09_39985 [Anaerolineae bacterium]|nr:hypothetical protein [Anaerolineales bacterium]MCQ3979639.1 hypothetical protein [Anaerolineae bacterium]
MRKEYDFSKGVRGKFYRPDVELNLPIYLEPDVAKFVRELARAKNTAIETIVNSWLRQDIALIEERTTTPSPPNSK